MAARKRLEAAPLGLWFSWAEMLGIVGTVLAIFFLVAGIGRVASALLGAG